MQLRVVFLTLISQLLTLSIRNVEAQTDYITNDYEDNPMLVHGEVKSLMTVKAIVIHIHSMQTEAVYGKSLKMVNKLIQNHLSTL